MRMLKAVRRAGLDTNFHQASSSSMFSATRPPQNEDALFYPHSAYGAAKLHAYWITRNYRKAYDLFAVNGILFNHQPPRHGDTFFTRKIARVATRFIGGLRDDL